MMNFLPWARAVLVVVVATGCGLGPKESTDEGEGQLFQPMAIGLSGDGAIIGHLPECFSSTVDSISLGSLTRTSADNDRTRFFWRVSSDRGTTLQAIQVGTPPPGYVEDKKLDVAIPRDQPVVLLVAGPGAAAIARFSLEELKAGQVLWGDKTVSLAKFSKKARCSIVRADAKS